MKSLHTQTDHRYWFFVVQETSWGFMSNTPTVKNERVKRICFKKEAYWSGLALILRTQWDHTMRSQTKSLLYIHKTSKACYPTKFQKYPICYPDVMWLAYHPGFAYVNTNMRHTYLLHDCVIKRVIKKMKRKLIPVWMWYKGGGGGEEGQYSCMQSPVELVFWLQQTVISYTQRHERCGQNNWSILLYREFVVDICICLLSIRSSFIYEYWPLLLAIVLLVKLFGFCIYPSIRQYVCYYRYITDIRPRITLFA